MNKIVRGVVGNLEIIFFLLLLAVILVGIAQKIHVPYPIILILGGAALSFFPGTETIYFNPNLVLFIFLPPILYYSAFGISFREFQANWKNIFSLALGLVALTTFVVGITFKWLFPQFPWALAFAFGAIISPPDAVAVTSILRRFSMNSRLITLLEGESLINDASAIIIYRISMIALMSGSFSAHHGALEFLYIVAGGILIGLVLGYLFQTFSKRYLEPVLGVVFSFTIPYVTFIVADIFHVSGVLAVVVNGLLGARILHGHQSSLRRILGYAVWDILFILLNCLIFILIGLQVRKISSELSTYQIMLYSAYALLFAGVMVIVRLIWVYSRAVFSYMNALRHRHAFDRCKQIIKETAIVGWAGMRGIVSLAIALAIPFTFPDGTPLEGRNEVVFMTFVVILITLVVPGLTLPLLIRRLQLQPVDKESIEQNVRNQLAQHADELISTFLMTKVINQKEYRFLKSYFRSQHKVMELSHEGESHLSGVELARREIIHSLRNKLLEICNQHEIDDKVLNHLENELDMLETHIARGNLS